MERKLVFVSQGFAGLLSNRSNTFYIDGLYTEDFTACNVLIIYQTNPDSEDTISLVHCDAQLFKQDTHKIIQVLEDADKVVLIHNEQGAALVNALTKLIDTYSNATLVINTVDSKIKGISVKFNDDDFEKSPIISHVKTPHNLIYHPQERQLTTIQQLEQIISVRDQLSKRSPRRQEKEFFQFWIARWNPFGPTETNFDLSRPFTKMDVDMFSPLDTWRKIRNTMKELMEILRKDYKAPFGPGGSMGMIIKNQIANIAAFHMEDYLHSYPEDSSFFFKRNIMDALKRWLPNSLRTDAQFIAKVDEIITENSDVAVDMERLLKSYPELQNGNPEITDDPDFSDTRSIARNVLDFIFTLEQDNNRRNKWAAANKIRQQYQDLANQKKLEAIKLCDENNLGEADELIYHYCAYLVWSTELSEEDLERFTGAFDSYYEKHNARVKESKRIKKNQRAGRRQRRGSRRERRIKQNNI